MSHHIPNGFVICRTWLSIYGFAHSHQQDGVTARKKTISGSHDTDPSRSFTIHTRYLLEVMARSRRREVNVQRTDSRRPLRQRDPQIVLMFNLRDIAVPLLRGTSSTACQTSRLRQKAGRKAWATRVARYGPSGRRVITTAQLGTPPHVVIPAYNNTQALAYDEGVQQSDEEPIGAGSNFSDEEDPQDHGEDGFEQSSRHVGTPANSRDEVNLQTPPTNARPLLQEVDIALPPEDSVAVGVSEAMLRLLDNRRTSLLGPQDITRPAGRADIAEEPAFPIFEDEGDIDAEAGYVSDPEDKGNYRPSWYGTGRTPRAPGPRRVSSPMERHHGAAQQEMQAQPRVPGRVIGDIVEPFARFYG